MNDDMDLIRGSSNPFADVGLPQSDKILAKADLANAIATLLEERQLTNAKAAKLTGFEANDFSRIRNAEISRFTVDRLMDILNALGSRVSVEVREGVEADLQPAQ